MLLRQRYSVTKPPPHARVDLTHPLGRKCQATCLFNDGSGTPKVPGGFFAQTYSDAPLVQYLQTQGGRKPLVIGTTTIPTWAYNQAGTCLQFGGTFSSMDVGFVLNAESYDLDYPEYTPGATVTRGETVCIIRRKLDTTLRASTLFGVEDDTSGGAELLKRCGAHVPYSDGTVYWDYGNASGANRLTVAGLSFSTNIEKWIFHAGPRGSAIWRDGIKLAEQSTALTRVCYTQVAHFGGWVLNGGNGLGLVGAGDIQDFNFVMYIADQWTDAQCRWWSAEPYAAFYTEPVYAQWLTNGELPAEVLWFDPVLGPNPRNRYLLRRPSMVSTRFEIGVVAAADVPIFDAIFGGSTSRTPRYASRRPPLVSIRFDPDAAPPQTAYGCTRLVDERFCSS